MLLDYNELPLIPTTSEIISFAFMESQVRVMLSFDPKDSLGKGSTTPSTN